MMCHANFIRNVVSRDQVEDFKTCRLNLTDTARLAAFLGTVRKSN